MTNVFYRMLHITRNKDDKSLLHAKEMEKASLSENKVNTSVEVTWTENTGKAINISNSELQEKLKRVTRKDIAEVTKEDVIALKTFLFHNNAMTQNNHSSDVNNTDSEKLRLSMEYLLQSNKFVDVLVCASSDTWKEAASDLAIPQLNLFDNLIQKRWGYLHSVLPFVNTQFLEVMREYVNQNVSTAHPTL